MNLRFEILEREEVSFKILCFSGGGWKGEGEVDISNGYTESRAG